MTENEFNPDYAGDPVALRGALADAQEAIGELQSELAAYRWIPVGERLPEEKKEVLIATSYGLITTVKYQSGSFVRLLGCRRCAGMSLGSVTHWMPIPPLPEKGKENE